jgi:hypothetical protein
MAENLHRWLSRLIKGKDHLKNIEFAMDCPRHLVLFQDRQKTIKRLFEASMLFTGTYAATAAILQADPPPVPNRRQTSRTDRRRLT